jgi:hypothetical protein
MLSKAKHLAFFRWLRSRDSSVEFILSKVEGPQNDITTQHRKGKAEPAPDLIRVGLEPLECLKQLEPVN